MEARSPWLTRGALYVLVVAVLALVGALGPDRTWPSLAASLLALPASAAVVPIVVALTIGTASLVPGVSDPGSLHPAVLSVPAAVTAAVLNVVLVRTLVRVLAPTLSARWRRGQEGPGPRSGSGGPRRGGPGAADQDLPRRQGRQRAAAGGAALAVVALTALAAQGLVALGTFVLGLGWGGPTYYAVLLQVLVGFGLIARLVSRGRRVAALVPLASAALTALLLAVGQVHAAATGCSDAERAASAGLAAPPGADVELVGSAEGCSASFQTDLSLRELGEHYEAEFREHGWEPLVDPGATAAATRGGIGVTVHGEPLPGGGAYAVVRVHEVAEAAGATR